MTQLLSIERTGEARIAETGRACYLKDSTDSWMLKIEETCAPRPKEGQ